MQQYTDNHRNESKNKKFFLEKVYAQLLSMKNHPEPTFCFKEDSSVSNRRKQKSHKRLTVDSSSTLLQVYSSLFSTEVTSNFFPYVYKPLFAPETQADLGSGQIVFVRFVRLLSRNIFHPIQYLLSQNPIKMTEFYTHITKNKMKIL